MLPNDFKTNDFSAVCAQCRADIPAGHGHLTEQDSNTMRWRVRCNDLDACADRAHVFQRATGPVAAKGAQAIASEEAKAQQAEVTAEQAAKLEEYFQAEALQAHLVSAVAQAVEAIGSSVAEQFNAVVPGMIADGIATARPLAITVNKAAPVTIKLAHKALPYVLTAVVAGTAPFLVGPAGSGKTTLAEQIATTLGLQFYMAARVTSEYKLVGFVDAQGKTVRTQFREAYEHGGVFLFDEVDASDPDALTAFNAALANGLGDFPDGMVRKHKDFHALAAGNTFGRGADRQYVGRNQLDAATLDRFQTFEIDYDEQLEISLAGNEEWTRYCQAVRRACESEKVRHIVSPRASISGAKLLAAGMERTVVEECSVWKGLDATNRARVVAKMGAC